MFRFVWFHGPVWEVTHILFVYIPLGSTQSHDRIHIIAKEAGKCSPVVCPG